MSKNIDIKINAGCGLVTPEGWINIDASWNARFAKVPLVRWFLRKVGLLTKEEALAPWPKNVKIHNISRGLPFSDSSVSVIYSSFMLEHLTPGQARVFSRDSLRVLRPGGIIRLVVPDLHSMVLDYLGTRERGGDGDPEPAEAFMRNLGVFGSYDTPLLRRLVEVLANLHFHKWCYDYASLAALLQSTGFGRVQRREPGESDIPGIDGVERASRLTAKKAMCVEAVKTIGMENAKVNV